jgi:hypothetical protein
MMASLVSMPTLYENKIVPPMNPNIIKTMS